MVLSHQFLEGMGGNHETLMLPASEPGIEPGASRKSVRGSVCLVITQCSLRCIQVARSSEVKRPAYKSDHLIPSRTEVKGSWLIPATPTRLQEMTHNRLKHE
jgi:hypothetical protein